MNILNEKERKKKKKKEMKRQARWKCEEFV